MKNNDYGKIKYEYMLLTWGGFYNDEHQKVHKLKSGYRWFNTRSERTSHIDQLRHIEEELDARHLGVVTKEGYHTRTETWLHRVVEYKDEFFYSHYNMGYGYPYDAAKYHMEWKWTPGFNDYAAIGDDEGDNLKDVHITQEWITGAFSQDDKL